MTYLRYRVDQVNRPERQVLLYAGAVAQGEDGNFEQVL
jgi:hypothetical protein